MDGYPPKAGHIFTGFGPEHYYTSCETLQTGNYTVGVNYYRGSAPETATVVMKAGTAFYTGSAYLSSAHGSSGNSSPVVLADIKIEKNPDTGLIEATITPR